jgi:hypothetical protein
MDNEEQKWSPNMMCPAETVQAAMLSATGQATPAAPNSRKLPPSTEKEERISH